MKNNKQIPTPNVKEAENYYRVAINNMQKAINEMAVKISKSFSPELSEEVQQELVSLIDEHTHEYKFSEHVKMALLSAF